MLEKDLQKKAEGIFKDIGVLTTSFDYRIKGAKVVDLIGFTADDKGNLEPTVIAELEKKFSPLAINSAYKLAEDVGVNYFCIVTPKVVSWYEIKDEEIIPLKEPPTLKSESKANFKTEKLLSLIEFLRNRGLTEEDIAEVVADLLLIHFYLQKHRHILEGASFKQLLSWAQDEFSQLPGWVDDRHYEHIDLDYLYSTVKSWSIFNITGYTVVEIFDKILGGKRHANLSMPHSLRKLVGEFLKAMNTINNPTIIDPACGHAGLLNEVACNYPKPTAWGVEINPKISRFAGIVSIASNKAINIINEDSLGKDLPSHYIEGFDVVSTVPAFGVQLNKKIKPLLQETTTSDGDILWLSLAVELAKPGGVISVTVPEGVLFQAQKQSLRNKILEHCCLEGIISLPNGTFYPAASVKSSILFLRRKRPDISQPFEVFVGEIENLRRGKFDDEEIKEMIDTFSTYQKEVAIKQ